VRGQVGKPRGREGRMSLTGKFALVTGSDVGNLVALLCQPEASWITGQLIVADGERH
jgi:NAD(P)-dependent dehydrogenase (short-subunit alcohol dehydrogenase family)